MEHPSDSHFRQCQLHPNFEADYCCFEPKCEAKILGCVICIKTLHEKCRAKFIVCLDQLSESIIVESTRFKPQIARLDHEFDQRLQSLLKPLLSQLMNMLLNSRERLAERAKEALGMTPARLNFEHFPTVRSDWKVELIKSTKKILLTKNNRVSAAQLGEYVRSFEENLVKVMESFFDTITDVRARQISEVKMDFWSTIGAIDIRFGELKFDRSLKLEASTTWSEEDKVAVAYYKTPVNRTVFEIIVKSKKPEVAFGFEIGLVNDRQIKRLRDKETLKPGEVTGISSDSKPVALTNNLKQPWSIVDAKFLHLYLDLETSQTIRLYSLKGEISLSGALNTGDHFLYLSIRNPQTVIECMELS